MAFVKATKKQAKLRMAIHGPSGSGKTMSALLIAKHLVPDGKIAVIDTERGSASKYADRVSFDTETIADNYHPDRLIAAMQEAANAGYDVLIIDSLSHFWNGQGGLLELVEAETTRGKAKTGRADSYGAWKVVDPIYRKMVQAILACPMHVIATMRAKQEYVKEEDERGKTKIRKVGMAPEMRDAFQYEADIEGMIDVEHNFVVGKTRCESLDGKVFTKPGKDVADLLRAWLTDGAPAPAEPPAAKQPQAARADVSDSVASELEAGLTWTTVEDKQAWVADVQAALKAGRITRDVAVTLSKRSQERANELGLTSQANGAP